MSDIKYNYQNKIDNLNARMSRYGDIIKNYDDKIKKAKKEENPNISSVIKAKSDYEHKIDNMEAVKEYYQEFVDTSDYLMQYINENKTHLLIRENEDLQSQLNDLQEKYDYLVGYVDDNSNQINSLTGKVSRLKNSNDYLKANEKYYKERYLEAIQLEEVVEELKCTIHDLELFKKTAIKKNKNLTDLVKDLNKQLNKQSKGKNTQKTSNNLEKTIDELKRRNKCLEEYCNDLLNRKVLIENNR